MTTEMLIEIEAALAEPEQEPAHIYAAAVKHTAYFFWREENCDNFIRQFTASTPVMKVRHLVADGKPSPQPREWQELREDEALEAFNRSGTIVDTSPIEQYVICQFISAALRAKNGG